jgi:hypothetical protein
MVVEGISRETDVGGLMVYIIHEKLEWGFNKDDRGT